MHPDFELCSAVSSFACPRAFHRTGCGQSYLSWSTDRSGEVKQGRTSRSHTNTYAVDTPETPSNELTITSII